MRPVEQSQSTGELLADALAAESPQLCNLLLGQGERLRSPPPPQRHRLHLVMGSMWTEDALEPMGSPLKPWHLSFERQSLLCTSA